MDVDILAARKATQPPSSMATSLCNEEKASSGMRDGDWPRVAEITSSLCGALRNVFHSACLPRRRRTAGLSPSRRRARRVRGDQEQYAKKGRSSLSRDPPHVGRQENKNKNKRIY
eukprot:CAMPEP_0197422332 /NCGR_PEP_ID=MMETSP1170-20131217/15040_1 /TAXON_ID=54406 /ORGANISM="Sarcinochrysis sp, Strain CCMP770" /LENGTH=114 /DNA_ID=CAMNT_0042949663 /DNA_START=463 /DNA_END=807 /DNA_ORIENTATION=+